MFNIFQESLKKVSDKSEKILALVVKELMIKLSFFSIYCIPIVTDDAKMIADAMTPHKSSRINLHHENKFADSIYSSDIAVNLFL